VPRPSRAGPATDVGQIDLDELEAKLVPQVRGSILMRAFDTEDDVMQARTRVSHEQLFRRAPTPGGAPASRWATSRSTNAARSRVTRSVRRRPSGQDEPAQVAQSRSPIAFAPAMCFVVADEIRAQSVS